MAPHSHTETVGCFRGTAASLPRQAVQDDPPGLPPPHTLHLALGYALLALLLLWAWRLPCPLQGIPRSALPRLPGGVQPHRPVLRAAAQSSHGLLGDAQHHSGVTTRPAKGVILLPSLTWAFGHQGDFIQVTLPSSETISHPLPPYA